MAHSQFIHQKNKKEYIIQQQTKLYTQIQIDRHLFTQNQTTGQPRNNNINLHLFRLTKTSNNQTTVISETAIRAFLDSCLSQL